MNDAKSLRISDEKCPDCGQPIKYGYIPILDKERAIECPCVTAKQAEEQKQRIEKGVKYIRSQMRTLSGMKTRQRGISLCGISSREGQKDAFEAAVEFVDRFSKSKNGKVKGLLFSGGVGSGKTLLSAAILNTIIDNTEVSEHDAEGAGTSRFEYSPVRFTSTVELFERLKSTYSADNKETAQGIMSALKECRVLALDDMGAEKPTEWVNERLFEIIDYRYNEYLPVIASTNATPAELKTQIGERSFDRLREMCVFVAVTAKSQRVTAKVEPKERNQKA